MKQEIIKQLQEVLRHDSAVHAFWIEGSLAENVNDRFSDIDLWVDVDDGKEQSIYDLIEKRLRTRGKLDLDFELGLDHPKLRHKTYHIQGTDPFLRIEVNVQSHSRDFQLIENLHDVKVIFDKSGILKKKPLDQTQHDKELLDRKNFLLEKISVGELWLEKEINRENFLEAIHNYEHWLVESVVELARIKYAPYKISFGLKHISRDLPSDIVAKIEDLYKVRDVSDLRSKLKNIKALAKELS